MRLKNRQPRGESENSTLRHFGISGKRIGQSGYRISLVSDVAEADGSGDEALALTLVQMGHLRAQRGYRVGLA
ncbi:MAG: hypothetical protein JF606_04035 [Burkholderiales bacterium]|jgi:hypothetical protein|nr:hypothetical protein [Burkholderiales bacterium]